MKRRIMFPLAKPIIQISALLRIDADKVIRRAGLPRDFLRNEGNGGTPAQAYAAWHAIEAESHRTDLALHLARTFAHGPFTPAMFAFSCSPDVETGLRRLAVFKPLIGPMRLNLDKQSVGLTITLTSADPDIDTPSLMATFEVLFILEAARTYTAEQIVPLQIGVPSLRTMGPDELQYAGVEPIEAAEPFLRLSVDDAALPLITVNSEAWPDFEKRMRAKLAELDSGTPMTARAKATLLDMLPSGEATIEAMCDRLHMSKRSLQRHLKDEGESFQTVLAATRSELALNYLSRGDLNVEEISYLLAYREPNSFYRAFQGWTGMTPAEARGMRPQ